MGQKLGVFSKLIDLDDIFMYTSTKGVWIRDRRLGGLNLFFVVGILVYVFLYEILFKLGYLRMLDVSGTVRMSLQQPVRGPDDRPYCNTKFATCRDAFTPKHELSYCCTPDCVPSNPLKQVDGGCDCPWRDFRNFVCVWQDGADVSKPDGNRMLIATYMETILESRNATCNSADACDKLWLIENRQDSFVPGIDNFTILLDHSVQQWELGLHETSRTMTTHGLLVNGSSPLQNDLCEQRGFDAEYAVRIKSPPCYIRPDHPPGMTNDVFALSTLLDAAGVFLDEPSYNGSGHTARYEGFTLIISINYHNTKPWRGVGPIIYTYMVEALPHDPYKVTDVVWKEYRRSRHRTSQHGVFVEVVQVGQLGGWSFQDLVVCLTTSLTFLALATAITDTLAMFILKRSDYYFPLLVDETPAFSHLPHLEDLSDDALQEELRTRNLPFGGDRSAKILRLLRDGWDENATRNQSIPTDQNSSSAPLLEPLMGGAGSFNTVTPL